MTEAKAQPVQGAAPIVANKIDAWMAAGLEAGIFERCKLIDGCDAKGGGWFRTDLNTVADFKGQRLRFGRYAGEVSYQLTASLRPDTPAGKWDRAALECPFGVPDKVRPI